MSLATFEADARNAFENAFDWMKQGLETHLPKVAAYAAEVEADPLAQAIEAVILPPDVRTMLASLVTKLGTPKSAEIPGAPAEAQAEPGVPADVPQPASGQPVAAGAAT